MRRIPLIVLLPVLLSLPLPATAGDATVVSKAAKAQEARDRGRNRLLEQGARHEADGVIVGTIGAVATDVLAITVQAGQHVNNQLIPYRPGPGDEVVEEEKEKPRHEVKDGTVVAIARKGVFRNQDGKRVRLGMLSPDGTQLFITGKTKGQTLDETVVDLPEAYAIQSADDAAYAQPRPPATVHRKGKPNGYSQPLPFIYTISLGLPSPLKDGASYTIRFIGVNTAQETATYVHRPRTTPSPAIHAIQTGYRPDDPYKRAFLSFWMGVDKDGRSHGCTPDSAAFEVVDGTGKAVFTGTAELAKKEGDEEQIALQEKLDYTKAAVRRLDFSTLAVPGTYRIHVPGIGISGPFRIAPDVWEKPFTAAMQGVLAQRQGIALGPPACTYVRGRTFHPDDGVGFYQMTIPVQAGQEGTRGENLMALAKAGRLERVMGVWGGYQDAGDWDSLGGHLSATYDLLGLHDLDPAAFARMKLLLPADEMNNALPDILDEALWQMPLWRRLQLPDGGVRGGYGYGWGCPDGVTSSMIRSAGVYAVDHETTLWYAAAAARTARILRAYDKSSADEYLASAVRAWTWAESHEAKEPGRKQRHKRAMAAVELLAATRDPVYDAAFKQSSELTGKAGTYLDQLDTDFAFARLPEGVGDAALKRTAVERITAYADHAIAYSRKNAFDLIAGTRTDYPVIFACRHFSTPAQGGLALIYAHVLTGKSAYLAAAVQGSNYCLGANPDNLSYCTGVGHHAQRFTFIVDAQVTGQVQDTVVGHIPYGQGNEGNAMSKGMNGWVQQWLLNFGPTKKMVPNWFDWPVHEQYIDFARYPLHNENCFNTTSVPAACYWFYLATRP